MVLPLTRFLFNNGLIPHSKSTAQMIYENPIFYASFSNTVCMCQILYQINIYICNFNP